MKVKFTILFVLATVIVFLNSCTTTSSLSNKSSDKFRVQKDGVDQKLIIAWASESGLEEYRKEGGEDWFWFVSDIYLYFEANPVENLKFCVDLPEGVTDADMKKLAKEVGNTDLYFGYYLIDGDKKSFIQHNMPDEIYDDFYSFFGIEQPETSE
jgi:hypothetical protein